MQKTFCTEFDDVTVEVVVTDAILYMDPNVIGNLYAFIDNQEIFNKSWAYTISGFYAVDDFGEELTLDKAGSTDNLIDAYETQLWDHIEDDFSEIGTAWDFLFQSYSKQIAEAKEDFLD